MSEEKNQKPGSQVFLKIVRLVTVVLLLIAVIGFGLLVGACGTVRR